MFELNNREIAILIWLGAILTLMLAKPQLRNSGAGVVRALFQRKIIAVLGLAALYSAGAVWLLWRFGIWEVNNLKTTLLWYLTFAFVAIADVGTLEKGPRALKAIVKDTLRATVIVVFIAEFYTLPLWAELLLLPVLALLAGMAVMAENRPEHAIVRKPLNFLLSMAGLGILAFSAYHIVEDLRAFATLTTAREFAVPILLSLMFLPFLAALSLYMIYENAAVRLHFTIEDPRLRRYAFWRGLLSFRTNSDLFQRFVRNLQLREVTDRAGIGEAIRALRRLRRREKHPPNVPWSEGWSPYKARAFLADQELLTNDYHCGFEEEWWAESASREIGGGLFQDRLIYRIAGTEMAVTHLSLELNAHVPGTPEESDARFREVAMLLVRRALGDGAAARLQIIAELDHAATELEEVTAKLSRDDWGIGSRGGYVRRLVLLHPAHRERYPGLE